MAPPDGLCLGGKSGAERLERVAAGRCIWCMALPIRYS